MKKRLGKFEKALLTRIELLNRSIKFGVDHSQGYWIQTHAELREAKSILKLYRKNKRKL